MNEPTPEEQAAILAMWKAAYENLAENMRKSQMWQISLSNLDILIDQMDQKVKDLRNDSKS